MVDVFRAVASVNLSQHSLKRNRLGVSEHLAYFFILLLQIPMLQDLAKSLGKIFPPL
jgi:hypothetical protein